MGLRDGITAPETEKWDSRTVPTSWVLTIIYSSANLYPDCTYLEPKCLLLADQIPLWVWYDLVSTVGANLLESVKHTELIGGLLLWNK